MSNDTHSTEINHLDPWGGMDREHYERVGKERTAAFLAQKAIDDANPDFDPYAMPPLTEEQKRRQAAIESKEECFVAGCPASPALGHKHDVHNPFKKPTIEIEHADRVRAARDRARPNFDFGLNGWDDDEAWNESLRRKRLHSAWMHEVNHFGSSAGYLLISPFTEADLQGTTWRPWGHPASAEEVSPFQRAQAERFAAILDALDNRHETDHWFYQHPFCRGCFPDDEWVDGDKVRTHSVVAPRLAHWMLTHGERGFPSSDWDGTLPAMPEKIDNVWLTMDELFALPKPSWLIDDLLPTASAGFISGPSNVGKSLLALDWAMQIALTERPAVYLIGEGPNGFAQRIDAWLRHHDIDEEDRAIIAQHFKPRKGVVDLFAGGPAYDDLLKQVRGAGIVVIDTLSRSRGAAEENSNTDMGLVMRRVDEIKAIVAETGGSVVVVAHTTKSGGSSGPRGAGVTLADQDFDWRLEPKDGKVRVTNEKSRDSAKGEGFDLIIKGLPTGGAVIVEPDGTEPQWLSDSVKARVEGFLFVTKDALAAPSIVTAVKDDGTGKPASRTQVYEALRDLEAEGKVVALPGSRKGSHTYRHTTHQGA